MSALASMIFSPASSSKRNCYKCGRRRPMDQMKRRDTPSGGAIYLCTSCSKPRAGDKGGAR